MKKISLAKLAVLSVVCAVVALMFSSCKKPEENSNKTVTLKWATAWYGQKDEAKVLEQVNKKLETLLPGVKIEFIEFNANTWTQKMAAKEQVDIAFTGYLVNMEAELKNRVYTPLNDYITKEKTPSLWKEWKEDFRDEYETGMSDGKLYAIPNLQPFAPESNIVKIPESLMEYFDVDAFRAACAKSPTTTREVYEVLDKFFKKIYSEGLVDTDTVTKCIDIQNLYNYLVPRGYGSISTNTPVSYKLFNDGKVDLTYLAFTDEYKLFLEYASKWYQDGYITKDVLVSGGSTGSRLPPITMHKNGNWFNLTDKKRGILEVYDSDGYLEQYYINVEPEDGSHNALGTTSFGGQSAYLCVPFTSKYPDKAIQLLELLRSPIGTPGNEVLNMLVYGIEGEHYTRDGDLAIGNGYTVQPANTLPYGKPHWVMGNVFLTYRTPNIAKGQADYVKNVYKEKKKNFYKTPLYRFRVDSSKIQTEIANINSVRDEFHDRLICGVDGKDYLKTYNQYIKKLKDAGIDKVIAEVKKQTDAYTPPAE